MTLQAQEVDLTDPQETWIVRPVWRVATGASFGLHGYVFVHKGALLVGVTFHANLISTGKSPDLPQCGCAVNVVAIAAVDEAFIHAMVISLGEIGFGRSVTPIAEIGLSLGQQVLRFLRIVGRVAIDTTYVVVVV
jgi:hypothetical protein